MSEKLNIHQKKNIIIDEMGGALPKTGRMTSGGSFAYHTIDDVHDALRDLFVKHGVSFECDLIESRTLDYTNAKKVTQSVNEKILRMRLVNCDDPEDCIVGRESAYGFDHQDKGPGKATAYAVKTWLVNVFHLKGQPDLDAGDAPEYITEQQAIRIRDMLQSLDKPEDSFLNWIKAPNIEAMTQKQYELAVNTMKAKK
jgi:hypothetical protein